MKAELIVCPKAEEFAAALELISQIGEMDSMGFSEADIAAALGKTVRQLRKIVSIARGVIRAKLIYLVKRATDEGMSYSEIANGIHAKEATVRSIGDLIASGKIKLEN